LWTIPGRVADHHGKDPVVRYHGALVMAVNESTSLPVNARQPGHSRDARRLRRSGLVPGVIYGTGVEPQHVAIDARVLRNTLAHGTALLQVSLDGGSDVPVIVKDLQRHPVRGEAVHIDLLRVNMNETIQSPVALELVGSEEAPGVREGGVLSQELIQVTVEALPGDIPEGLQHDVSGLESGATLTVGDLAAPQGVTFVDDPDTVVATMTAPSAPESDSDELEVETELVDERGVGARAQAEGSTADEAASKAAGAELPGGDIDS
jgi:large subunit ribosomal protein L25